MRLVSIADPSSRERIVAGADLVERRIDLGADARPVSALDGREGNTVRVPNLWTVRSRAEGGAFDGTPVEAAALLARHVGDAACIDAERDVIAHLVAALRRSAGGTRVPILASLHGRRPIDLPREGVSAWKIARPVETPKDMMGVLDEARRLAADYAAGRCPAAFVVPYGPLCVGLRVVCAAIAQGAGIDSFVYGVADDAEPGFLARLPHVPPLSTLRDDLRLGEISGRARLFGLVGRPPSHSPSPRIHNAAFRSLGLDAIYLPEIDLDADAALRLPYAGWSVTTPLKEEVARRCHELDDLAKRAGAVNTVVRLPDGRLRGTNTDASAILSAIDDAPESERGPALVIGGGGYARAAIVALLSKGYSVRVAGRGRARATAAAFGVEFMGESPVAGGDECVVVNATPVGADGELSLPDERLLRALRPGTLVLDGPYARGGSPGAFAVSARRHSLPTVSGGELLVSQARLQSKAFTGSLGGIACAFAWQRPRSLVLVGPRGSGKTTVGRMVARKMGRPFVDTDEEIGRAQGRPAGRVLAERGETEFRSLEALVLARALDRKGAVIAVGGGALGMGASRRRIRRMAYPVRLDVAPGEAARRIEADPTFRPRLSEERDWVAECERIATERAASMAITSRRVATTGRAVADVAAEVIEHWVHARRGERTA